MQAVATHRIKTDILEFMLTLLHFDSHRAVKYSIVKSFTLPV